MLDIRSVKTFRVEGKDCQYLVVTNMHAEKYHFDVLRYDNVGAELLERNMTFPQAQQLIEGKLKEAEEEFRSEMGRIRIQRGKKNA